MSRKNHSVSSELALIKGDLGVMSIDELYSTYGIVVKDDGTVYDELEMRNFKDTTDWLRFYGTVLQQEFDEEQELERWAGEFDDEQ